MSNRSASRQAHGLIQGLGQWIDADFDPPTAPAVAQLAPRRAHGGHGRTPHRQRLGDDDAEVLTEGGQDEEITPRQQVELLLPADRPGEGDPVAHPLLFDQLLDFSLVAGLIGTGDQQVPVGVAVLEPLERFDEVGQPLLGVDARHEHHARAAGRGGPGGVDELPRGGVIVRRQRHPVDQHGQRGGDTETAEVDRFLGRGGMHGGGVIEDPTET
jgi:hypothetical protein